MPEPEQHIPASASAEISARLAEVLSRYTLEEVVRSLQDVGHSTSVETVRRYREGLSRRIDSAFLAAVVAALGVDPAWLLTGPGSPEDVMRQADFRAASALHDIAKQAAVAYVGPKSAVEWQEEMRRGSLTEYVQELLEELEVPPEVLAFELLRAEGASRQLADLMARYGRPEAVRRSLADEGRDEAIRSDLAGEARPAREEPGGTPEAPD